MPNSRADVKSHAATRMKFIYLFILCLRPCADFSRNNIGSTRRDPFGSFARGTRGNVTSAGWQVTLCDPMWHVSSRSGVATLRTAIHLLLTYLLTHRLNPGNNRGIRNVPPPGTTKYKYRPISCRRWTLATCCRQRWMIGLINWPSTVDSIVDLVDLQRSSLLHWGSTLSGRVHNTIAMIDLPWRHFLSPEFNWVPQGGVDKRNEFAHDTMWDKSRKTCIPITSSIRPSFSIEHRLVTDRQTDTRL